MTISETVLEMHYHRPLIDLFRETYGIGPNGKFNFYKYSPQREVFIGFDQAFAMTEMTDAQFFTEMKSSAMNGNYKLTSRFVAYFLQFKVVTELKKRSKQTPTAITYRPHYRASLDTTKKDSTGFSQHELLFNLNRNDQAMVYYACPMLFEKASLYEVQVDLDPLRLADLCTCPSDFKDNSNHYLYFNERTTDPIWCSEPVQGKALTAKQFVDLAITKLRETSPGVGLESLLNLLTEIKAFGAKAIDRNEESGDERSGLALVADSLTIIRVDEQSV
jgi:hypothetical protein